jgi:hypothetical protein
MAGPQTPPEPVFIQKLRTRFRSIQTRDGDARLRRMLSAERLVSSYDRQMKPQDRQEWLAALDQIEADLLPNK